MARRKEQQVSKRQALEAALEEFGPNWFNSKPLFAAVQPPGSGAVAVPLTDDFVKRCWNVIFIDPCSASSMRQLECAKEFKARYEHYGMTTVLVLKPSFEIFKTKPVVEIFLKLQKIDMPVVIDKDLALSAAFGSLKSNRVVVLSQGKAVLETSEPNWPHAVEEQIQKTLREDDPGLATPLFFDPKEAVRDDLGKIEFNEAALKSGAVKLQGEWIKEANRVTTRDSKASLSFRGRSTEVNLIAQSTAELYLSTEIVITIDGHAPNEKWLGVDSGRNELYPGYVRVTAPGSYRMLEKMPLDDREISLRFPQASRQGAAVYGVRFGEILL